jgi:hypothetical protein
MTVSVNDHAKLSTASNLLDRLGPRNFRRNRDHLLVGPNAALALLVVAETEDRPTIYETNSTDKYADSSEVFGIGNTAFKLGLNIVKF